MGTIELPGSNAALPDIIGPVGVLLQPVQPMQTQPNKPHKTIT
jgi:hypothetical protein